MGLKNLYQDTILFISHLASRYSPRSPSSVYVTLTVTGLVADYYRGNNYLRLLLSAIICLLASRLSIGEIKIYDEATTLPLVLADPKHTYHTIIVHLWAHLYAAVDWSSMSTTVKLLCGCVHLYPDLGLTVFPYLESTVLFLISSHHLQFLTVIIIILTYRSYTNPAAAHGALPEGINGIWSAIVLHGVSIVSPAIEVQWFTYHLYYYGFCGAEPAGPWILMHGAEAVGLEGLLTNVAAWLFGYHPTTAHIVFLVVNIIVHPLRQRLSGTGRLVTPILKAQFWGLVWFLAAHIAFTVTKQPITFTTTKYWGENLNQTIFRQSLYSDLLPVGWKMFRQLSKPWYQRLRRRWSNKDDTPETLPTPFRHLPITKSNTIRILRILPSLNNKAPIHCELLEGHFTPSDPYKVYNGPKYTGISYCWDPPSTTTNPPSDSHIIHINNHPHPIPQSVHHILRAMRQPLSPYQVWIDSICINQADPIEKASQVQLMRLIYENASHVTGWLRGTSTPDPGNRLETTLRDLADFFATSRVPSLEYRAREMLGRINSTMYIQQEFDLLSTLPPHQNKSSKSSSGTSLHPDILPGNPTDWIALATLLTNPFFTRVWIIQEIVAARHVTLNYGGQIIPWDLFARAMAVLSAQGLPFKLLVYLQYNDLSSLRPVELPGIANGLVLENLRRWYRRPGVWSGTGVGSAGGMLSLEDTLKLCGRFESSWDVDRVFALLGVARDVELLRVRGLVDYRGDVAERTREVFLGVARRLIAKRVVLGGKNMDKGMGGKGVGGVFEVLRFAGVGMFAGEEEEGGEEEGDVKVQEEEGVKEEGKGMEKEKERRTRIEGLPSWAPDWTEKMNTALFSHPNEEYNYRASGQGPCQKNSVRFSGDRLLLKGTIVARVKWISPVFTAHPKPGTRQFVKVLGEAMIHLLLQGNLLVYRHTPTGSGPQLMHEAYWRTLFGDMSSDARPINKDFILEWGRMIAEYERRGSSDKADENGGFLKNRHREDTDDEDDENRHIDNVGLWLQINDNPDNTFSHMLMTDLSNANPEHRGGFTDILGAKKGRMSIFEFPMFALGRRFCVTDKGHMGLVPAGAVVGDRVTILEGAPTPHVLRPVYDQPKGESTQPRRTSKFQLVGECYIHGIMDGEALDDDVEFKTVILV